MRDIVKEYQKKFRRNHQRARRYTALLLALALTTSLFVNWQLHGVGIAKTAEYLCGELEHEHTAACYEKQLVCGYEEGEPEDWNATMTDDGMSFDDTFDMDDDAFGVDADDPGIAAHSAEPEYIFVPHEHTDDCYQEVQELTCLEEEHTHDDSCFDEDGVTFICDKFEHTHDDSCYTTTYELVCGLEEGELVEEVNPDYDPVALFEEPVAAKPVVVDPVIETPVHHHTDACYEEVLVCGLPEHHHTVNCLSDPLDGTQDEDEWLAQTGTTLSGNWADDLLAVAESQLGYEQSERNFQLDDADGETVRHYTRYGNDYGNDYGPWDVMFLSYCLKYADIPQSAIPQVSSVLSLHSQLRSALYNEETGSGYAMDFDGDLQSDAAMPGDIVIYNGTVTKAVAAESQPLQVQDDSADADIALLSMDTAATTDTAPHIEEYTVDASTVGIVSDVDEDFGTLTVISGDVDGKVAKVTLNASQVTTLVSVANAQQADYGVATLDFKAEDGNTTVSGLDGKDYVTNFEIKKENKTGQYITADTVVITDKVMGRLDLSGIPAQQIQQNGYKVYVQIPDGIDCSSISGTLDGDKGSYCFAQKDGHWFLVLSYDREFIHQQETSSQSTVDSWVQFNFQWDETQISKNGQNDFKINASQKVTITINDKKDDTSSDQFSLKKSAGKLRYDDTDAYIDYTVTLELKKAVDAPFTITDTLTNEGGAAFAYTNETPVISAGSGTAPAISWADGSGSSKVITLGTAGGTIPAGQYIITYPVKCSSFRTDNLNGDAKVMNKVNATYEDEDHSNKTSTELTNTLIKKDGKVKNGFIEWTVKLNKPNDDGSLSYLKNAVFTDTLPDDLFDGKITVREDGGSKKIVTLSGEQYNTATKTITYPLTDGYHSYEITYKTKAPENTGISDLTVSNTGTIKNDGLDSSHTAEVTISSDVLSKTLVDGSHTSDTATMNWSTTINADDLNSYVYYDWSGTLSVNGQHVKAQAIVPGSVVVKTADGTDVTGHVTVDYTYSRSESGVEVGLFSVDLRGKKISGPVTITYQTTAALAGITAGDRVVITNYGQLNEGKTVSGQYDFVNTSEQWKYFYKYGGAYDYNSVMSNAGSIELKPGEALPWTIVLNDKNAANGGLANKEYDQWVVRDVIPEGLLLDENSICVSSNVGPAVAGTDYTYTLEPQTIDGKNCTVITFTLNKSYIMVNGKPRTHVELTYNTYLDPNNSALQSTEAIQFTNHANFICDGTTIGDTKFTETVTRDVVGKQGTFDESTGTLTYYVKVNPYGVKLLPQENGELSLYDQLNLPTALKGDKATQTKHVWLEGVSVYQGEFVNDEFVPTTWLRDLTPAAGENAVSTDSYFARSDATFTQIKAYTKVPDATPLVLVFHYTVSKEVSLAVGTRLDFTNKVLLNNNEAWSVVDKSVDHTYSSSAGADIHYNNDRLTIYKYSGSMNNPLAGAKFLLEQYDDSTGWTTVNEQIETNDSGNYVQAVDRDVLYRIRETEAPAGYLLPDSSSYFYFYVSHSTAYTPPAASGAVDVHLYLVTVSGDNVFQNFYYNVENAKNPDYVPHGSLKVSKLWQDFSGNTITDAAQLSTFGAVTVKLTMHSQKATVADGEAGGEAFTRDLGSVQLNSSNNWTHTWTGLESSADVWYTVEEIAMEGYKTSYTVNGAAVQEGSIPSITLSAAEGSHVQILNQSTQGDYKLPSTGGAGTKLYTAGGGALMLAALVCGVCRKRRRERRAR